MNAKQLERLSLRNATYEPGALRVVEEHKPRKPRAKAAAGKCPERCIEGKKCCLNGAIPHQLCVCNNPDCSCHSRERYEGWK